MDITNRSRAPRRTRPVRRTAGLALACAAALLGLTACGGPAADADPAGGRAPAGARTGAAEAGKEPAAPRRLLWMGDSVGVAQAPALEAAMRAGGVEFASMAAVGGGGVIGETAAPTWKDLPGKLRSFAPDVVAYQITTYDWGTPAEQRAGYERLARAVSEAGARLLIVSAPPFRMDDFYRPHRAAIASAPRVARDVAARHPETVRFLDASALWGGDGEAPRAQRSKDGIHSCQQGSAAFAAWFGERLGERSAFTPAAPERWATGPWTGDEVYGRLGCD
ncbi:SGNH/GDSL hydrolase family protein [Streptomyces somaliensis DSM 40738]|uniref:SGNH/GDSL hydrolase family protein n=1 Tax=Streptomyces somaliensis (strain ATCC 33201 / DSM 40738 / JCM 12659 / KCTC 9044 / NCTC 11332 / NRRL B-12077 / IP 733) TaxID=1134445 RepID=A0AA44DD78_STRE0|nr:SGNH/GDSL hydrolase family protein [Streptomyces somaliensis]MCQ0023004.1 SGNH/GDSL hydrolase family protein [Streptomyces somaliensis DSM 40738]NKY14731.1 SGNH/GDSL hydrolase family protein [Streptomyces somaliensis DSM 40738]